MGDAVPEPSSPMTSDVRARCHTGSVSSEGRTQSVRRRTSLRRARRCQRHGTDHGQVDAGRGGEVVCGQELVETVERVGHGQYPGEQVERFGHGVAGHDEPAQQELGKEKGGHELHGLELGGGEGGDEQAERHARAGVGDGEHARPPTAGPAMSRSEQPDADGDEEARLDGGDDAEGEAVAGEEVELGERHRQQPLQGAGGAFAQHGDRGDEEHRDQREDAEQRQRRTGRRPGCRR